MAKVISRPWNAAWAIAKYGVFQTLFDSIAVKPFGGFAVDDGEYGIVRLGRIGKITDTVAIFLDIGRSEQLTYFAFPRNIGARIS